MSFEERLYIAIGQQIRERRRALDFTQEELAQAEKVDLTRTSITNIEYGQQRIQIHTLYAIADVLDISIHDLLPAIEVEEDKTVEELIHTSSVISAEGERVELAPAERQLIMELLTEE